MRQLRLLLALALTIGLVAPLTAGPKDQAVILSASVSGTTLTIHGLNLGGGSPLVTLDGSVVATVTSATDTTIVATIPACSPRPTC